MNEKDLLEEIGKVSEELIAAHALPDAKRFGEGGADKSVTAKEQIVMSQKKNEYIRNPFIRALPGIAAAAAVIVAGVIILPKTNLIRMPGASVGSDSENGYRLELESAELRVLKDVEESGTLLINANLFYPQLDAKTTVWYGDYAIKKGDTVLYELMMSAEQIGGTADEPEIPAERNYKLLQSGNIPVDAENTPLPVSFLAGRFDPRVPEEFDGDLVLSAEFHIVAADPAEADEVIRLEMPLTYQTVEVTDRKVLLQDVRGWHFELAKQEIIGQHLLVDKRSSYHDEVPEGDVISTDPEGPAEIVAGSTVRLYVSLGPNPGGASDKIIPAPDFVGLDWEHAELFAEGVKLVLEKKLVESDEPAGTIVGQNVEVGTELPEGAVVTVEVSGSADSAALTEVEIPIAVPANANGKFYFTVYSLFDLGEDPTPITTTKVFEAGEDLPEIGTAKVLFSSENNVDAGIMLYNAETGEKAQIATFYYIHGSGFQELPVLQELPGRTNPELMNVEEAFRSAGLLK